MSEQQAQQVQTHLAKQAQGANTQDQQLVFDPRTGELVVQRNDQALPSPDAVVADQIAEEGFF